jgi:gamma-glutamylcyclotransferase (GGCT)/AIG2-like uncharacterized protein YtfP
MAGIWYFAYGSNMQRATFCGRRGLAFARAAAGRAAGWRLVFDKPPLLPVGESYANIVPDAAASVLGVLYEVDAETLASIDLSEGVLIGNYERRAVTVRRLDQPAATPLDAVTLTSTRRDPRLLPSTRYMALLIEGALEHGLPSEYVSYLRGVPARPPSVVAAALQPLLDGALGALRPRRG